MDKKQNMETGAGQMNTRQGGRIALKRKMMGLSQRQAAFQINKKYGVYTGPL